MMSKINWKKKYLQKLREKLSAQKEKNYFEAILQTYGYSRPPFCG